MVDRFDSDRRRFIVAIKNDPAHPDPRGLTPRERQIAEYVGLGCASKEIAYTLGLSESSITNCTARAQDKLGMTSRAELVSFFAPNGFRRKLAEISVADEKLLVGSSSHINTSDIKSLSETERQIVALLIAGSTNADIARRRGASGNTVANQVQSVFRKLCVRSRGELVARLQEGIRTYK